MYIANRKIRTSIDGVVQEYAEGDKIAADAYDEATFAKWLKRGLIRHSGTPAPARQEPAAQQRVLGRENLGVDLLHLGDDLEPQRVKCDRRAVWIQEFLALLKRAPVDFLEPPLIHDAGVIQHKRVRQFAVGQRDRAALCRVAAGVRGRELVRRGPGEQAPDAGTAVVAHRRVAGVSDPE